MKIFEPITFPIAMSLFFFKAATMDVTSSGSEVPAAIIILLQLFLNSCPYFYHNGLNLSNVCPLNLYAPFSCVPSQRLPVLSL